MGMPSPIGMGMTRMMNSSIWLVDEFEGRHCCLARVAGKDVVSSPGASPAAFKPFSMPILDALA